MGRKSWIAVAVVVALWAIGSMLPPKDTILTGDIRVLDGPSVVWLATTSDNYDPLMDALAAASRGGPSAGALLFRLAESGRARAYAKGTEVLVVETAIGSVYVQIASGEARGQEGWVQKEHIGPKPR